MENVFYGIIIWLLCVFGSTFIYNRAMKQLTTEKKGELLERFSKFRSYSLLAVIVIAVVYFLMIRQQVFDYRTLTIYYFVAFIAYLIFVNYYAYNMMKKYAFDPGFIRLYILSIVLRFVGLIIFFVFLIPYF